MTPLLAYPHDTMAPERRWDAPWTLAETPAALGTVAPVPAPALRCVRLHTGAATAGHDLATRRSVARSLALLLGCPFEDGTPAAEGDRSYLVPTETLIGFEAAARLGVRGPDDLFGGIVPHAFVATKVITHPLVAAHAAAPAGWSARFSERVRGVVLPGFAVFSAADARRALRRLLADGAVRVKSPDGVGGGGQSVVGDATPFETLLSTIDPAQLARDGLVLERNLSRVQTCSVGQVRVGPFCASYVGVQGLVPDHAGREVYGGSRLRVVRGDFDALLRRPLARTDRLAVEQALVYHAAACEEYGVVASRANYDIAQGLDESGRWRSGVLEQSWRIGGASGAEVAALFAFQADPALESVTASTHEVYAEHPVPPPGAQVHFDDTDPQAGRLLKYAQLDTDAQP
ncbi:DUF3182 family protein [Piscinibacter sakaiensis]|nr:DUF3182 family protein [Piscinibacter sakaiensis]